MGSLFVLVFGLFKFGKIGGMLLTMLIALAVYGSVFGWQYGAGFIALLMIHENGPFSCRASAHVGGQPAHLHSLRWRLD